MSADVERIAAVLGELWDQGNCTGLDGWVGPGRGAEVDDEALLARERDVKKYAEQLAAAGFGHVPTALHQAADDMPIETLLGADKASVWLRTRAERAQYPDSSCRPLPSIDPDDHTWKDH